jgi:hypothetical protein
LPLAALASASGRVAANGKFSGVGELRYDEAQTRSPTTKMIFLILSRNRNISKSKNSELIIELNALTFVQMQE